MRNKKWLQRYNTEDEQSELDGIVCVCVFCYVHCAPALSMHPCGTMVLRSESRLRRSGAGTAWHKRAALFHSVPPSNHFPFDVL